MERLEQTSRELATIYQTGKAISSGRQLGEILKEIVEELLLAIPAADNGAAYIYNEFNDEFDPAAGDTVAGQIETAHPFINFIKGRTSGAVLNAADEIAKLGVLAFEGAKSLLVSPIFKETKLLGFTALWSPKIPRAFKSSHMLLAATVSSQLAEAIENLRHQQEERDRQRLRNAKDSY
jgi:GAF domain-containing protein